MACNNRRDPRGRLSVGPIRDTTPKRKGRPKPDASFDDVIRIHVEDELGGRVPVLQ
jgi:hypothetical protein